MIKYQGQLGVQCADSDLLMDFDQGFPPGDPLIVWSPKATRPQLDSQDTNVKLTRICDAADLRFRHYVLVVYVF